MARRKTKNDKPLTTAQRLGSLVKSARDIMRKDKGLNGDLDRLPMLTWILFLKFLDDHEVIREDRAKMKTASPEERNEILKRAGFTDDELEQMRQMREQRQQGGGGGPPGGGGGFGGGGPPGGGGGRGPGGGGN